MKRYLVFAGDMFYPRGGMEDFYMDFDDSKEAIECADCQVDPGAEGYYEWASVFDSEKRMHVYTLGNKLS